MTLLVLKRYSKNLATYGVLLHEGVPISNTLELPWHANKHNVSCIPVGTYDVSKYSGSKFKDAFYLHNVVGRSSILIHAGNSLRDTQGCILVGEGIRNGALINSRAAMLALNEFLPYTFKLMITEV